ncbi:hypothetical protein PIIN_02298 [Serendipita indica DSM 11827]|uniref:Uncharacterized protein n=1 Tax=Serendipita indica (strain DSM 11827) TaxID=1109443 RepID=G4TAU4_SERID|nr:hypothetical protein PIIN_02298 [Serendipita indica DSM 11827]
MPSSGETEQLRDLLVKIRQDELDAQLTSLTPEDAFEIGSAIRSVYYGVNEVVPTLKSEEEHIKTYGHAIYSDLPASSGIVIHLETFTGHKLFTATAGEPSAVKPDNWIWVEGKKNIVKRFHRSSYAVGRECMLKGKTPEEAGYRLPEYSAHGGGMPLWIKGVTVAPIAVVVVSGLPQQMDHQLIVDGIRFTLHKRSKVHHRTGTERTK